MWVGDVGWRPQGPCRRKPLIKAVLPLPGPRGFAQACGEGEAGGEEKTRSLTEEKTQVLLWVLIVLLSHIPSCLGPRYAKNSVAMGSKF